MEQTARFGMPCLAPGQLQKELFHNEALQTVDMLLCPLVEGPPIPSPPASPATGACFLVATGGTGAWLGHDGALACFTDGGWRFVPPSEGLSVLDRSSGEALAWRGGGWEQGIVRAQQVEVDGEVVLRNRQPAISDPAGGATSDSECRSAVAAILAAMRTHGLIA